MFVDYERSPGVWLKLFAELVPAEPEVGAMRCQVHRLTAFNGDGEPVDLTTEEVGVFTQLFARKFERDYYKEGSPHAAQQS